MNNLFKYFFLLFFAVVSISSTSNAQYKYLFDVNENKRNVSVRFYIKQSKEKIIENIKVNREKRLINKHSRAVKKHTYKIQTREVKRRMRKSRKKAAEFNREKCWLSVTIKKLF